MTMKTRYGVEDLSISQEAQLYVDHPYSAKTRNNKIKLQNDLEHLMDYAKSYSDLSKLIPEEDSKQHAERVERFAKKVHQLMIDLSLAYDYCAKV